MKDYYCNEYCSILSEAATCSVRKGVLRNFAKFTRKHLCQSLFLNCCRPQALDGLTSYTLFVAIKNFVV